MTRQHVSTLSVIVALLIGAAVPAAAQTQSRPQAGWFNEYRTFSLYEENDSLAFKGATSSTDETYTQGLRLTWDFAQWPGWAAKAERFSLLRLRRHDDVIDSCSPAHTRLAGACGTVTFGLGQTMFSPRNIITTTRQTRDQPYAGYLFGSAGVTVLDGRLQSTSELTIGVTGPGSLAQDTQSFVHWAISTGSAKPSGWAHQLKTAAHVGLLQNYAVRLLEHCASQAGCTGGAAEHRVFDLAVRPEYVLTTAMARGSLGATLRLGYGFPERIGTRIPATLAPPATQTTRTPAPKYIVAFATYDRRFVGHNAFITGGYADGGTSGWRSVREIELKRQVTEYAFGVAGGWGPLNVSYQSATRSLEWAPTTGFDPRPHHRFGSLTISLNAGR